MPKITLPETGLNGLNDGDLAAVDQVPEDLFEFTCTSRERDEDGLWHYFVVPTEEYDVLDFKGHQVLINGVARDCVDFYLDDSDDDNHMVIVSESG